MKYKLSDYRAERCCKKQPVYGCSGVETKLLWIPFFETHSTMICKVCHKIVYNHCYSFKKPDPVRMAIKTAKLWNKKFSKQR